MKNKIYIWLPAIMLVYLGFMVFKFKDELLGAGRHLQFYGTIAIDIIVTALMFIFLRKRTRMRERRREEDRHLESRHNRPYINEDGKE